MSAMSPAIPTTPFYTNELRRVTLFREILKNHDLGPHPPLLHQEQGKGVLRLTTLIGWATGIEKQKTILVFEKGYMRVAQDNHASVGKAFTEALAAALFT